MHWTEEKIAFRDSVRRMVERHVAPIAAELDRTDRFPEELVPIFGDMGLLQSWVPEAYGGPNGDLTTVCIAREEVSKVSEACALLAGQNSIGMILPLLHFGTEEQRQRFLPEVAKGRTLTCVCITEPDAGSDVASMKTTAKKDGGSYVINGQKCFITYGNVAHYALVFARTAEGKGFSGISAFLVDTSSPGFTVGRNEKKMGLNGVPNVELFFENLRVPAENMIGEEGQGFLACMKILDMNRPTIAAAAVGLAQGALDAAIAYAKQRRQFNRAIAEFQGIQFMLADMRIQVEAARSLVYETARRIDSGDLANLASMSSMAKCFATDMAMRVTTDAVQVFGGLGYMKESPVERMMRDAKINQIFEGTNQIQRLVVARHMLMG